VRALVTGATGFVGSHVAHALADRGDDVRVLLRRSSRLDNIADLACEPVVGDLLDAGAVCKAVEGCELVFHVAADYRLWCRNPHELYRANVDGSLNVLRAAQASGVRRVVYTSTVGALGIPPDGVPGTEDAPVALQDMVGHYKRSKFLAEQEVRRFASSEGLPVVIVSPSTPVGDGDLKPTPTGKVIVDFLNKRMPAYVQTGLNLIDVRDVAAGHLLAAERGVPGERYILGHQNMTLREILELLADITGMKAPKRQIPLWVAMAAGYVDSAVEGGLLRREPRIPLEGVRMAHKMMYFDASKAIRELGLPQSPVREALARAVQWYRDHGYAPAS
jgi:dihydroflavonol-4-reductase